MRFCEVCGAAFRSLRTCPSDGVTTRAGVSDPLLGAVLGERYRVLDRIAAGGMGQVYRATHTRIACLFAVKVLYGDLAYEPSMQSRFLREAEIASCLSSRFITRVLDFGQSSSGLPYLAMEYLDGATLFDVVTREGALDPRRAALIAQRIALGLGHAHERGIVHRDLKTENVIVVREDDEPDVPKLLDFGVARLHEGERLTTAGFVLGTPLYMAPEQFAGADVDARADLYALGVMLFEMITGVPPFEAPTVQALAEKHRTATPPSLAPALAKVGLGDELDGVVSRLLAKEPRDRYGSAREAAQAIAAAVSPGRTTSARGPTPSSPPPPSRLATSALKDRLELAILSGAPAYNAGDHARCLELYRATALELVATESLPLAVAARFDVALARATAVASATAGSWELRYAFDEVLSLPPAVVGTVGTLQGELAVFDAMRGGSGGNADDEVALAFARRLAASLEKRSERPELVRTLFAAAAARYDRRGAACVAIHPLLDSLRVSPLGATQAAAPSFGPAPIRPSAAPPSIPPVSTPRASVAPPSGSSDEVMARVTHAILIGAPAYNQGRYEVCQRVYRETALELSRMVGKDPAGAAFAAWLTETVARADQRPPLEAAWVLRHAFDAILASRPS